MTNFLEQERWLSWGDAQHSHLVDELSTLMVQSLNKIESRNRLHFYCGLRSDETQAKTGPSARCKSCERSKKRERQRLAAMR